MLQICDIKKLILYSSPISENIVTHKYYGGCYALCLHRRKIRLIRLPQNISSFIIEQSIYKNFDVFVSGGCVVDPFTDDLAIKIDNGYTSLYDPYDIKFTYHRRSIYPFDPVSLLELQKLIS